MKLERLKKNLLNHVLSVVAKLTLQVSMVLVTAPPLGRGQWDALMMMATVMATNPYKPSLDAVRR